MLPIRRPLLCLLVLLALGLTLPTPAGSQSYLNSGCAIQDASCTSPTSGATCPPEGGACSLPPGLYNCDSSGRYGAYSYCVFSDAVGNTLGLVYTFGPDCTPVEFTGGQPRLQWDPLLNMFAINDCVMFTSTNVAYGPYLLRSA